MHTTVFNINPLLETKISKYKLNFQTTRTVRVLDIPALLRGQLGNILKKKYCSFSPYQKYTCLNCTEAPNCRYTILFSPTHSCIGEQKSNNKTVNHFTPPRPFTINLQDWHPRGKIQHEGKGTIEITLLGERAIESHMDLLESLKTALSTITVPLQKGCPAPSTPKCPLIPLEWQCILSEATTEKFMGNLKKGGADKNKNGTSLDYLLRFLPETLLPEDPLSMSRITLKIITPIQSRMKGGITFVGFIKAIIRRLRDLKRTYHTDNHMGIFTPQFYDLANKVKIIEKPHLVDLKHFSQSQKKEIDLKGWHGRISFEGPVGSFIPLLAAGSLVGIGNKLTYGNGKYKIVV